MALSPLHTAGFAATQLFGQGLTYTYDDVIFLPGHIDFAAHEVRNSAAGSSSLHCCLLYDSAWLSASLARRAYQAALLLSKVLSGVAEHN